MQIELFTKMKQCKVQITKHFIFRIFDINNELSQYQIDFPKATKWGSRYSFSLKTVIFIVFTVIGNIPDLKVRLLTGIGLSSGYLQIVKFSLFFWTFSGIFSLFLV